MGALIDWYRGGGPVMPVLSVVALVALAIIVERVYALVVRARTNGRAFMERSIQLVRSGKIEDAIKLSTRSRAALPDLGLLILRSRTAEERDLQNVADAAVLSMVPRFKRRLQYLPTLATCAVLVGFLGLAIGVERALASAAASAGLITLGPSSLTGGISLALRPLIAGIAIAAAVVLLHGYLLSQAEAIIEDIHEYAARLINALIDRPDVRLGHR